MSQSDIQPTPTPKLILSKCCRSLTVPQIGRCGVGWSVGRGGDFEMCDVECNESEGKS